MGTSFVRCEKCKKLVPNSAVVCSVCGTRVAKAVQADTNVVEKQSPAGFPGAAQQAVPNGFPTQSIPQGFPSNVQGFPTQMQQPVQGFPSNPITPQGFPVQQNPAVNGFPNVTPPVQEQVVAPPIVENKNRRLIAGISLSDELVVRACGIALAVVSVLFLIMTFGRLGEFTAANDLYESGRQDTAVQIGSAGWSYSASSGADAVGNWGDYANSLDGTVNTDNVGAVMSGLTEGATVNVGGVSYPMVVIRSDGFYAGGLPASDEFDLQLLQTPLYTSGSLTYAGGGSPAIIYIYANASNMEYKRVTTTIESNLPSMQGSTESEALIAEQLGRAYQVPAMLFTLIYIIIGLCVITVLLGGVQAAIGEDTGRIGLVSKIALGVSGVWVAATAFSIYMFLTVEHSMILLIVVSALSLLLSAACWVTGRARSKIYYT